MSRDEVAEQTSTTTTAPHAGRWLVGLTTSLVGSGIFLVALSWVAVQTTSPANVGWILLANAVPEAVVLLVGGVLVDRLGPKRIIVASDVVRTLVMVALVVVVGNGTISPLTLGVLAAVFGVVDGFFQPAVASVPRFLGPGVSVVRLSAAKTVAGRVSAFVSSPVASALLLAAGAGWAFGVNAALFAVSVVALWLTRMVPPAPQTSDFGAARAKPGAASSAGRRSAVVRSMWADLASGFRIIRGQRALSRLLVVAFLLELGFVGQTTAGVPLLAHEAGWGVEAIGWIIGGFGLGSAVVATLLSWRRGLRRSGPAMCIGLAVMGLGLLALAEVASTAATGVGALVAAGGVGVLMGVGAGLFGTLANAAMLVLAPPDHVGRVMAAITFTGRAAIPFSFALTGLVTSAVNARAPFVLGGAVVLVAAAVATSTPAVRTLTIGTPTQEPTAPPAG